MDRIDTLNVAARIRNSLHSNGIHHKQHVAEQSLVVLKGVAYEFKDGQKVECAGWEHIAHALGVFGRGSRRSPCSPTSRRNRRSDDGYIRLGGGHRAHEFDG